MKQYLKHCAINTIVFCGILFGGGVIGGLCICSRVMERIDRRRERRGTL